MTHISSRALANLESDDTKRIMKAGTTNGYDSDYNPEGVLSMGIAENRLMWVIKDSLIGKCLPEVVKASRDI